MHMDRSISCNLIWFSFTKRKSSEQGYNAGKRCICNLMMRMFTLIMNLYARNTVYQRVFSCTLQQGMQTETHGDYQVG